MLINVTTITVKVAQLQLCHSRMLFVRACSRETQKMVFDAHDRGFFLRPLFNAEPSRPQPDWPRIQAAGRRLAWQPARSRSRPSALVVVGGGDEGLEPGSVEASE